MGPHPYSPPLSYDDVAGQPGDALTLFMPLVDLTPSNGATQFDLGSHLKPEESCTPQERADRGAILYAPAGSAIAFDFKLWHRGLGSHTAPACLPMASSVPSPH